MGERAGGRSRTTTFTAASPSARDRCEIREGKGNREGEEEEENNFLFFASCRGGKDCLLKVRVGNSAIGLSNANLQQTVSSCFRTECNFETRVNDVP